MFSTVVVLSFLLSPVATITKDALIAYAQAGTSQGARITGGDTAGSTSASPQSTPITLPEVVDPHLPTLTLDVQASPDTISVGEAVTVTITVFNSAPDPANNLVVSMPVPDGAIALDTDHQSGYTWTQPTLASGASASFSAALELTTEPAGDTLMVTAQTGTPAGCGG